VLIKRKEEIEKVFVLNINLTNFVNEERRAVTLPPRQ